MSGARRPPPLLLGSTMLRILALSALLALPSCFCCLFSPEVWSAIDASDDGESLAAFEQAWTEQRFADAAAIADDASGAVGGDERGRFLMRAAFACEQAEEWDDALAWYDRASSEYRDPDATRSWKRLAVFTETLDDALRAAEREDPAARRRDKWALRFVLAEEFSLPPEQFRATLNALWLDLANQGFESEAAEVLLVMADSHAAERSWSNAEIAARIAARYARKYDEPLAAAAYLREARWWLAEGFDWQAAHKLRRLAACRPGIALDFAQQVAEVQAAVAVAGTARREKAEGEFTFPADVSVAQTLAHVVGAAVERDGSLAHITLPDGRRFTIGTEVDAASGTLDPFRRCMRWKGGSSGDEEVLLFANGDLFLGEDAFAGSGLYLSATRPAAFGPCRYGQPMARANAVVEASTHGELADGSANVALEFADGTGFVGVARRDGELWLPLGHGLMTLPDHGIYIGKLVEGRPDDGCLLRADGKIEFFADGVRIDTVDGDGTRADDDAELFARDGDEIRYFDRDTGVSLQWDRLSFFQAEVDAARLAQWRDSEVKRREREEILARWAAEDAERRAQREAERAEHLREIEEYNAQVRAERLAAGLPEFDSPSASSGGFDFLGALEGDADSDLCVRCRGAGENYVWGGASQQMVWRTSGASSGGWVDATVHTSGHMERCTLCDGTGLRWGTQR